MEPDNKLGRGYFFTACRVDVGEERYGRGSHKAWGYSDGYQDE